MPDILRMRTPLATPDSLREMLQLSKKFYQLHTSRYLGYEDMDGLQYVGISENFGSEMLFESRKLRMNKPPAKIVKPCALLSYFFDISHSDFIETYPQQNLLMCCLKTGVLIPNHTYQLKFTNTHSRVYVRSSAYSDQDTVISVFRMTMDNPILVIDDVEYPLYVGTEDNSDEHVTWYFSIDKTTEGKYTIDDSDPLSIELTIPDLNEFIDLPAIWLCTSDMQMLPPMKWYNEIGQPGNLDWVNRPLIEFGVNGNDTIFLYPYMYGANNFPVPSEAPPTPFNPDQGFWYVKVYGDFVSTDHNQYNMTTKITRIGYIHTMSQSFTEPSDFEYWFTYDDNYTKISLTEFGYPDDLRWTFRKAVPGDADYDGTTYNNQINACIWLQPFKEANVINVISSIQHFLPLFHVTFKDVYFHPYEAETNAMNTGLHLDMTTDYSDNGIKKKYGVIHELGEFDGLPPYYSYYLDRTIHHAHVEMYAIRDDANVRNQHAMDKQTAAVILDSSIPINDYGEITSDMKPVIVYEGEGTLHYISIEDNIVSTVNFLSNIGLINKNHFGDVTIPQLPYTHKFVYHGNRRFSTGVIDVDPALEYGRGYLITNDGIGYENNETSKNPKAPRTAARVCDIPTDYMQLQHISGVSPSLIESPNYVRTFSSFTNSNYLDMWNNTDWFIPTMFRTLWISTVDEVLNMYFRSESSIIPKTGYVETPRRTVSLAECDIRITTGGSGYSQNDQFGFSIGGLFLRGTVTSVTGGAIDATGFTITTDPDVPGQTPDIYPNINVPITNLVERVSTYPLTTVYGSGHGAKITITVPTEIWDEQTAGIRTIMNPNTFALVYDSLRAGVHFVQYNMDEQMWDKNTMIQVTGDLNLGNLSYEDSETVSKRSLLDVYLYNILTNRNIEEDFLMQYISGMKTIDVNYKSNQFNPPEFALETLANGTDIFNIVSDAGLNQWNSFVAAVPKNQDTSYYYTIAWSYDMNASFINGSFGNGNLLFPKFSGLNFPSYDNSWTAVKFNTGVSGVVYPFMYDPLHSTYETYDLSKGCTCLVQQSVIPLNSILKLDSDVYPSDAARLYNGVNLEYNLYRFDHLKRFRELDELRAQLSEMSSDQLYTMIEEQFGPDTIISKYYSYEEKPYETAYTYMAGDFILYQTIITQDYVEHQAYAADVMIVDTATRDMYRSTQAFFSSTLANDIANHKLEYVSKKPTEQVASLYRATKAFVSSDIQSDTVNGSIVYVGPSVKFNTMVNYIIERTYQDNVHDNPELTLFLKKNDSLKVPVDDPIGGFVPLVEVMDQNVKVRGNSKTTEPLYVFRIDEPISDLSNFRMYDGDIDISPYTMLIVKSSSGGYRKYVYHNNAWEWAYS